VLVIAVFICDAGKKTASPRCQTLHPMISPSEFQQGENGRTAFFHDTSSSRHHLFDNTGTWPIPGWSPCVAEIKGQGPNFMCLVEVGNIHCASSSTL
jgi:hypothetical protein